MLKSLISHKLSILILTTVSTILPLSSANANTFQETEVNQEGFIAIAQPFGENKYNLIVIEQIPEKDTCWNEDAESENPVNVDLLLINFDFSGHCRRSTDANGYSIRYDGEDYGLDFLLTLTEIDGELVLMGSNRSNPRQPPIIVGTSDGLNGQPMKIKLNPGWRFTKRTYEGKVLGHVYFSYDSASVIPITEEIEEIEEIEEMNNNIDMSVPEQLEDDLQLDIEDNTPVPETSEIREIIAPEIEPLKQMKKSTSRKFSSMNKSKIQYINSK